MEKVDNEGASEYVKLSLYQEIKAPEEYPLNGQPCYGYIIYDSEVDISYRMITSVIYSNALEATVTAVFPDYPEDKPMQVHFSYNWKDGALIMNGETPLPNKTEYRFWKNFLLMILHCLRK